MATISALCAMILAVATVEAAAGRAIVFAFDTSGSLREADLERARGVARSALDRLSESDTIAVLTFDDRPEMLAPFGSDRAVVEAALDRLVVGGQHTTLYDAIWDSAKALASVDVAERGVVLFTDGRDENSTLLFADAERAVVDNRVVVFAIGVGRTDERFMRRFTKLTRGTFYPASDLERPAVILDGIDAAFARVSESRGDSTSEVGHAEISAATTETADATDGPPPIGATSVVDSTPSPAPTTTAPAPESLVSWLPWVAGLAAVVVIGLLWRRRGEPEVVAVGAESEASNVDATLHLESIEVRVDEATADRSEDAKVTEVAPWAREEVRTGPLPALSPDDDVSARGPEQLNKTLNLASADLGLDGDAAAEALDRTFMLARKPVLIVRAGRDAGKTFLLPTAGEIFVGRAQVNDVSLDDRAISSRHLRVRAEGQVITVLDLGSTNGTYLNDRRLEQEVFLSPGDVVRLGETELVFKIEQKRA